MSQLTPFGLLLRQLRLKKNIRLSKMADDIGSSPSIVSGIELGRRPIPKGYVDKVAKAIKASVEEFHDLMEKAQQSQSTIKLKQFSPNDQILVNELARKVDELSDEEKERIKEILSLPALQNEEPFRRKRGSIVAATSYNNIWQRAEEWGKSIPIKQNNMLDISYALESLECYTQNFPFKWTLGILSVNDMPKEEGKTDFSNHIIYIREDIWRRLDKDDPRARFTACHEFGHLILHSFQPIFMARGNIEQYPIYRDAEWQADVFAASLLMPASKARDFLSTNNSLFACANHFGISMTACEATLRQYAKKGLIVMSSQ
ncbi:MAG: ImmA/IrrE family metallo-endopeptidase [Commensalibacter sp.]